MKKTRKTKKKEMNEEKKMEKNMWCLLATPSPPGPSSSDEARLLRGSALVFDFSSSLGSWTQSHGKWPQDRRCLAALRKLRHR